MTDGYPKTYGELFRQQCPYYMAMGMSYDEFWNGDVSAAKAYREAFQIYRNRENFNAWAQGLYIYNALTAVGAFVKFGSKLKKPIEYPKEPFDLYGEKKKRDKARKAKGNMTEGTMKVRDIMLAYAEQFNAARRKTKKAGE